MHQIGWVDDSDSSQAAIRLHQSDSYVIQKEFVAFGASTLLGAIDNSKKEAKDLRYCFHATIPNLCHVPKHAYK